MSNPSTPSNGPSTAVSPPAATIATTVEAVEAVATTIQHSPPAPFASQNITWHQQPPPPSASAQPSPARILGPLQPLPRGRPPRPKPAAPPGHWQASSPASQPSYNVSPVSQPQPQLPQPLPPRKQTPLEPSYTRGGHLIGGFNPARYAGVSFAHPKFSPEGKLLLLTGANALNPWVSQITYVARNLSCYEELTKRFTAYPKASTVKLFICETRFATAWRVLEGSISGQVWAYMRVLGYSSIKGDGDGLMSPQPADCYEYAKKAAARMLIPGTPEQPPEERKRMVEEVLMAQSTDYPSERAYKKGINWLRLACDSLIKQGDYDLAVSLYEPIPEWAPKPPGYDDSTTPSAPAIERDPLGPRGQSESRVTPDASGAEDSDTSTEEVATGGNQNESARSTTTGRSTPPPPKLIPDKPSAKKRKRTQDEGSETASNQS
ncbi:hypothetical protein VP1G_04056 [Cytospora mali]|uniref:Uncharacterized protein n=1 Tax=Cytospora mali TaxID=578113 RepID=A0A194UYJ9_CYTMA|nr:hypothetical protein VP1G_04056 [Valsa mali var. pyri (nom. inval.)]